MKKLTVTLAGAAAALAFAAPAGAAPTAPDCSGLAGEPIPAKGPCQAYASSGNPSIGGAYRAQCDVIVNQWMGTGYPATLYTPGDAKNRGTCLNTLRSAHQSEQGL